jgi:hypothetical protein
MSSVLVVTVGVPPPAGVVVVVVVVEHLEPVQELDESEVVEPAEPGA